MDLIGGVIGRSRAHRPRLGARLAWARLLHGGDPSARLVEALVSPGSVALDLGANWGMFTWALARRAGPEGRVHAFEPNPEHRPSLNAVRAGRSNIVVHSIALSDRSGTATLRVPSHEDMASSYEATLNETTAMEVGDDLSVDVPVRTLDGELGDDARRVAFVKCDVEGHEAALLRGARRTLAHCPTLLIEIEQRLQTPRVHDTFRALERLGYIGYAVRAHGLAELSQFDVQRDQLDHLGQSLVGNRDYVNDFLFARHDLDLTGLRDVGLCS